MKKLLLSAAFIVALSGYAAAQSTEGTTTSATTEAASKVKDTKEKPKKVSKKERKAAEAQKPFLLAVPKPDMKAADAVPPIPKK